ncbi:MAG: alpha/beta fold hydrolase [Acidimicrobiales bacterium]
MTATAEPSPFRFAGNGGLAVEGEQWGDPSGAPVVLLHGGGQNRHAWKGSAAALARAGYYVIAYDARGHGDSEWSAAGEYDMEDNAADLTALLALLDRPPTVVGASMGGMSSLWAQGTSDAQLYSAVVLVDVTPRMELSGVTRIVGFMTANPDGFDSLEQASDVIASYNPHRERSGNVEGLRKVLQERAGRWHWRWDPRFITSKAEMMSGDPDAIEARMAGMAQQMLTAAGRLEVPTLLIRGAQSDLVSPDTVREFLAAVPHAAYVDVSGTGHMVAGDDNDAFTTAVLDFLHEHVPTGPTEAAEHDARHRTADAVRRFGHALVHHDAPTELLDAVAAHLSGAADKLEREPIRDRLAAMLSSARVQAIMSGDPPPIPTDDAELDFAPYSLVGGPANPFGVDAVYIRRGSDVVAHVSLGAAFEGPPGRAHGGIVSAIVDETMTALLSVLGAVAFTTRLEVDYLGPTPLHTPLEFRASLIGRVGRTLTIACFGRSGDQEFARATGTFVEADLRRLLAR